MNVKNDSGTTAAMNNSETVTKGKKNATQNDESNDTTSAKGRMMVNPTKKIVKSTLNTRNITEGKIQSSRLFQNADNYY